MPAPAPSDPPGSPTPPASRQAASPRPNWRITDDSSLSLPRRLHKPRTVGLGLGALCVGAGLLQADAHPMLWPLLLVNGFLWPHLAFLWARYSQKPGRTERRSLLIDAFCGGFWVPAMGFNLLPSVLVLTMLTLDNIAVGGRRLALRGLGWQVAGGLLAWLLLSPRVEPASNLLTQLACVPFLVVYPVLIGVVAYRLSRKLHQQREALRKLLETDTLSGLYSRSHWDRRLQEVFLGVGRHRRPAALLLLDIDHFKDINDHHGHLAGDEVIRQVGGLLQQQLRAGDVAGRYGGEEFGIILPDTDLPAARGVAERIRQAVAEAELPAGDGLPAGVRLTMSLGVAVLDGSLPDRLDWVAQADQALYQAKRSGRNAVCCHVPAAPNLAATDPVVDRPVRPQASTPVVAS